MKEKKASGNGWRTTSIILIIVLVLETMLFLGLLKVGNEVIEKESDCSYNICSPFEGSSYYYDSYEGICYCYLGDTLIKSKYIG